MFEIRRQTHPMVNPLMTAHGTIAERSTLLLGIDADGETGWTEYAPLPGFGMNMNLDAVESELRRALDETALDGTATEVTDLAARLVDAARNDLTARLNGVALADHLAGSDAVRRVAVNATVSAAEPHEVAIAVRAAVDSGHTAIKLKVAAWPLNQDIMRIVEAWRACGSAELRLDANQGWTRGQADEVLRVAADHGIALCEEPTPSLTDWAHLSTHGVTLAADESVGSADDVEALLATVGVGAVVLKPAVLGGPVATHRLATAARAAGKRVIVTSFFDGPIGLAAAAHVAAACGDDGPHGIGTAAAVEADFPTSLRAVDGHVTLPLGIGLGVDP